MGCRGCGYESVPILMQERVGIIQTLAAETIPGSFVCRSAEGLGREFLDYEGFHKIQSDKHQGDPNECLAKTRRVRSGT